MNKNCEICDAFMENVHHATKYCEICKPLALKRNHKKHHVSKSKIKFETDINKYYQNFISVATNPENLTTNGFNEVSGISVKSYCNFYKSSWIDIVNNFGFYDSLIKYISNEYKNFNQQAKKQNIFEMTDDHPYITRELILTIGTNVIMAEAGIKKTRYADEDCRENFNNIKRELNRIPLYNDFEEYTQISLNTYANRYSLKGRVYDNVVKMYVSEDEYEEYLSAKMNHKSKVGKITGRMANIEIPEENLKNELCRIFNFYNNNYKQYPSRRLFDKISKYDSSVYRKRYDKSWLDICHMFGYKIDKNNKNEKILLEMISKILYINYQPQRTWKWLIGVGGKNMYCDGYFEKYNLVVEYDGRQHRIPINAFGGVERFEILQQNDKLKDKLVTEHGLKMLRIDSRDKWYDEDYLINRLNELCINIPKQQIA